MCRLIFKFWWHLVESITEFMPKVVDNSIVPMPIFQGVGNYLCILLAATVVIQADTDKISFISRTSCVLLELLTVRQSKYFKMIGL